MSRATLADLDWDDTLFSLEDAETYDSWAAWNFPLENVDSCEPFLFDESMIFDPTLQPDHWEDSMGHHMPFKMAHTHHQLEANTSRDNITSNQAHINDTESDELHTETLSQLRYQDHRQLSPSNNNSDPQMLVEKQVLAAMLSPPDSSPSSSEQIVASEQLMSWLNTSQTLQPPVSLPEVALESASGEFASVEQSKLEASPQPTRRKFRAKNVRHVCCAKLEKGNKSSIQQHHQLKPQTCPFCGKQTDKPRDLHRHIWTDHEEFAIQNEIPSEKRNCPVTGCDKVSRKDNLARHCITKHGLKLRWKRGKAILEELTT